MAEQQNLVYRVMRADEHPQALVVGIRAKNPLRRVHPQRHVTHGNIEQDNWISTTRNLLWALSMQPLEGQPIYTINLDAVQSQVIDLTILTNTRGWNPRSRNLALRASEVLIDTHIPPEAIISIIPYQE
ncbi:MAG: hypothetical protein HC893_09475 [Chloroflexaceae bacterium]|nr:hypothetical protein [Chloroflexaceae bacterium]NJL34041.1 hypothetical protein [Chloroflexaceae bacterium]NJO05026.1 hypothetical protein [Chloroflexaceae bacterium]NJO82582.1 hypothetical protein [Blastochloris sp.]